MPTIRDLAGVLKGQYVAPADMDDVRTSALEAAQAILALGDQRVLRRHKKKLLTEVLWLLIPSTNRASKYATRYRSVEVVRLANEAPDSDVKVELEHVTMRKASVAYMLEHAEQLLLNRAQLDSHLAASISCVVTKSEHARLKKNVDGWDRYRLADPPIRVYDMAQDPPKLVSSRFLEPRAGLVDGTGCHAHAVSGTGRLTVR